MITQRALASKEREVQAQRLSRFGRASLIMLATLLSFAAVGLMSIDQLYRPDTFVINQLKIKGKFRYLDPADVEEAIGEQALTNFFAVQLDSVKRDVEKLAWVQQADVRREWPNTLLVNVREHIPVMRWETGKWVTSGGEVLDLPGDVRAPSDIVLSANEADAGFVLKNTFAWKKRLRLKQLELRKVQFSASRAWTLTLYHAVNDAQFDLLLGREKANQRLARFELLFDKHFRESNKKIQRVDARYPDGLAIKMNELDVTQDAHSELANLDSITQNTFDTVVALTGNQR